VRLHRPLLAGSATGAPWGPDRPGRHPWPYWIKLPKPGTGLVAAAAANWRARSGLSSRCHPHSAIRLRRNVLLT
jgi:hypothetical protein